MFKPALTAARCLLMGAALAASTVHAADPPFPHRPIKIIAPSSPGGILDVTSRVIAKFLAPKLGQPVTVENMAGAGGIIGVQGMLRAEPDGHTLVMGSLGPNAANYSLYSTLPYKIEDFAPIINVVSMPNILVVRPDLPVKDVAGLAAYSHGKPGGASMAISTAGASGHLMGKQLQNTLNMPAIDVVYKGAAPAITALTAGQVDFMVDNMVTSLPLVQSGKLRALAVYTDTRVPMLPDVPTIGEQGHPELAGGTWIGLLTRAGTPKTTIDQLNKMIGEVLADPEVLAILHKQGGVVIGGSPADFDKFIRAETARWAEVIRKADIKVN